MKQLSLIVPTYNRSKFLNASLESFKNQSLSKNSFEIIVVDNNSKDETKNVVLSFIHNNKDVDIKYVFEKSQGLHYARNSGVINASGKIIVFGDDDIIATTDWLKNILNEFETNEDVGIVGGKIIPMWKSNPPRWVYDYGTSDVHAVFAYLNYGEARLVLKDKYLFGCNFAIKKDLILEIGGSPPDTFPQSLRHLSGGGECIIVDEVRQLGYKVVYLPEAIVYHHADSSRVTLDYFIDRYQRFAIEDVFCCYRLNKKSTATCLLIKKACTKIFSAYFWQLKNIIKFCLHKKLLPLNKISPKYFIKIQKAYGWALLKQIAYVFFTQDVYKQIIKKNYLARG